MVTFKSRVFRRKDPLRVGIPVSLVIHAVLLGIILSSNAPHPPQAAVIEVSIEPPRAIQSQQQQIVSAPDESARKPPPETSRLSDADSAAVREQVKRGDNGGLPAPPSSAAKQPPSAQHESSAAKPNTQAAQHQERERSEVSPKPPQPPSARGEHHLKSLKLDDATLAMKFGAASPQRPQPPNSSSQSSLSDYQAFSRPPGTGAAFLGTAGISDHLPNLPDGDITMLNAKASTYASFVRRVAIQVFTQLRSQGWERLSRQQIQQLTNFTTIEAVLSKQGALLGVKIHDSSGSSPFDAVVHQSVSAGAKDPNPPPGAEAQDGLIHFVFKARSWSQMAPNPRSGMVSEHRWLLLATGLE